MRAALLLLLAATADPRPELIELRLLGEGEATLARIEEIAAESPERAAALGLAHLQGRILEEQGRLEDAAQAYLRSMAGSPALAPYSRLRLARLQIRLGHPEVAAGLVMPLLTRDAPSALLAPASKLLHRCLLRRADCRLLDGAGTRRLPAAVDRTLRLAGADCALRKRDLEGGGDRLLGLLRENRNDDVAREAMRRLVHLPTIVARDPGLVGLTLHHHRHFDRDRPLLEAALATDGTDGATAAEPFELHFAYARSHFWQDRFRAAAEEFARLAERSSRPEDVARALYHQARSHELMEEWPEAVAAFERSFEAEPEGDWAAPALIAALRLDWRRGREAEALARFERLGKRREWGFYRGRAALFLAASDLVQGRTDRAGAWLDVAGRAPRHSAVEVAYWRARLLEETGEPQAAVEAYSRLLHLDVYHPLSRAALDRLERDELAPAARHLGRRLARSPRLEDLDRAWILLGDDDDDGQRARARLTQLLAADPRSQEFLRMQTVPPGDWPLWGRTLEQGEELLLALGLWDEGAPAVERHFPPTRPSLALTGAELLARGDQLRRALSLTEKVERRLPERIPRRLLPETYRFLHHPFGFRDLIVEATVGSGIDPRLLAAVIREESRFDPEALSPASARGLAQFIIPTAERIAPQAGVGTVRPEDLFRPEVAIRLGAAYLSELRGRFDGELPEMLAAYNAGSPQAHLWRAYCFSGEPEEYLTKVAFQETRMYLQRVLSSYAQYRELYPSPPP